MTCHIRLLLGGGGQSIASSHHVGSKEQSQVIDQINAFSSSGNDPPQDAVVIPIDHVIVVPNLRSQRQT